jgi:hypothetical protein
VRRAHDDVAATKGEKNRVKQNKIKTYLNRSCVPTRSAAVGGAAKVGLALASEGDVLQRVAYVNARGWPGGCVVLRAREGIVGAAGCVPVTCRGE